MSIWRRLWPVCLLAFASLAFAQDPEEPESESDAADQVSEYGIRFTPGMAQAIAGLWVDEVLVKHYEMDKARNEEARAAITRRLMKLAHTDEERGQELAEYTMTTMFDLIGKRGEDNLGGIPPELAQGAAQRLLPFMPAVRDLMDGVVQDVRPMLGLKGQLKMTGELTMVKMAMDAFETNMQKWAKGEVDPFGDPFRNESEEVKKEEDGQSKPLKNALRTAEAMSERGPGADWDRYIEDAKKYYDLDPSQAAMADSLLRDYRQRALIAVGGAEQWRTKIYRNRLWWGMSTQMPGRWNNPLRTLLDFDYKRVQEPIEALESELKGRVEGIPTGAQRDAAERRLLAAFAEKGVKLEDQLPPAPPAEPGPKTPSPDGTATSPGGVE